MMIGSVLGMLWGRGLGGALFANSGGVVDGVRVILHRHPLMGVRGSIRSSIPPDV